MARVFAPIAFRFPPLTGRDYPAGWQDLPDALADQLVAAGVMRREQPERDPQGRPADVLTAEQVGQVLGATLSYFGTALAESRAIAARREAQEQALPAIYFDPSAANDFGDGSITSPFRDLTNSRLVPGRRHLLRAGTTITVPAGATSVWLSITATGTARSPIVIGRYGPASAPNPIINCTGAQRGIRFGTSTRYVRVRDLEIYGCSAGVDRYGVSINTSNAVGEQDTTRGIVIERLTIRDIVGDGSTDCNGVKTYGADVEVRDCLIYNIGTDAIWCHGFRTRIEGNTSYNVGTDGRPNSDCVEFGHQSNGSIVRGNYFDKRTSDFKQCIFFAETVNVSDGVLIEDNICLGFNGLVGEHTPIFCGATNSIVRRNFVSGGYRGIQLGANTTAYCNVVVATVGLGIKMRAGSSAYHNTIVQTGTQTSQTASVGIQAGTNTDINSVAENNVIIGFSNSILAVTGTNGLPTLAEQNNTFGTNGSVHYRLDGTSVAPGAGAQIVAAASALSLLSLDADYRPTGPGLSAAGNVLPAGYLDRDNQPVSVPTRGAYAPA